VSSPCRCGVGWPEGQACRAKSDGRFGTRQRRSENNRQLRQGEERPGREDDEDSRQHEAREGGAWSGKKGARDDDSRALYCDQHFDADDDHAGDDNAGHD
jgi:hypothetical protein